MIPNLAESLNFHNRNQPFERAYFENKRIKKFNMGNPAARGWEAKRHRTAGGRSGAGNQYAVGLEEKD
ncbi:hypothetical protein FACS189432_03910 [Bacteroidia bacterium]|nr:hypothetical protein FACS189432_03910 [Bacteroidia bacterium]